MPDPLTLDPAGCRLVIATGHHLSLALVRGNVVLASDHRAIDRGHAEALVPALGHLLDGQPRPAQILVETGPGSFTGLRMGIAAARALGLAWQVPVHGLSSTLLVAAAAAGRGVSGPLIVALAAPRGQIWLQRFEDLSPSGEAVALTANAARNLVERQTIPVTGSGARALGIDAADDVPSAADARRLCPVHFGPPQAAYVRVNAGLGVPP
jgi:tRNA threonylcarbamoyl adenosine modification protein YeaZ